MSVTSEGKFTLLYPVDDPVVISQRFGENRTGVKDFYTRHGLPAHEGIDFAGKRGDLVFAAADGVVKAIALPGQGGVVPNHAYGKHIKLTHECNGQEWETDYCHLQDVVSRLKVGDTVKAGELIGFMGNSGNVVKNARTDGVHLHFQLRKRGATARGERQTLLDGRQVVYKNDLVNPEPYFQKR